MTTADRMTRPVITISPEETCDRALALMDVSRIDHLPVCDGGRLVGLLQRESLIERVAALLGPDATPSDVEQFLPVAHASGVMTYHPPTITPATPLARAAEALASGNGTALLVVEEGRLVGILTVHDLLLSIVDGRLEETRSPSAPSR